VGWWAWGLKDKKNLRRFLGVTNDWMIAEIHPLHQIACNAQSIVSGSLAPVVIGCFAFVDGADNVSPS
jgi:hypothetical protein